MNFSNCTLAPADPILGLSDEFKRDKRLNKINLGAGIYKDEQGITPVLKSVKAAEKKIINQEKTKSYLSIEGLSQYCDLMNQMLFGGQSLVLQENRVASVQAPGGPGSLRVVAQFLNQVVGKNRIWISQPTWSNHHAIFKASDFEILTYDYYDAQTHALNFDGMLRSLEAAQSGDVLLLHACCHNPTGVDLASEQWSTLVELCRAKEILPLFDAAYLGFSQDFETDTFAIRLFAEKLSEMIVVQSCSKNFSLYNERIGSVHIVSESSDISNKVFSQLKPVIRSLYSNPPAHGALIVAEILSDQTLKAQWIDELAEMRERILKMRRLFLDGLSGNKAARDFSFIGQQRGMFSFSGLSVDQVRRLKADFGIYMLDSGRMSVAGMTNSNMDYLVDSIKKVL